MAGHVLVVGGSGMLAGAARGLAREGWQVSVLARRARSIAATCGDAIAGFDCDYHDVGAFEAAVAQAMSACGPIRLAIAWFHTLKIEAPRRLAGAVGEAGAPGLYVQVLGSAVADPARPDRLQTAATVAAGLPNCVLRQVVLGFQIDGGASRWLTNEEISAGVLAATAQDRPLSVIGRTEPWTARPGA